MMQFSLQIKIKSQLIGILNEMSHISNGKICSCDGAAKSKTIGSQMELQQIQSIIPSPMSQNMLKGSDVFRFLMKNCLNGISVDDNSSNSRSKKQSPRS